VRQTDDWGKGGEGDIHRAVNDNLQEADNRHQGEEGRQDPEGKNGGGVGGTKEDWGDVSVDVDVEALEDWGGAESAAANSAETKVPKRQEKENQPRVCRPGCRVGVQPKGGVALLHCSWGDPGWVHAPPPLLVWWTIHHPRVGE